MPKTAKEPTKVKSKKTASNSTSIANKKSSKLTSAQNLKSSNDSLKVVNKDSKKVKTKKSKNVVPKVSNKKSPSKKVTKTSKKKTQSQNKSLSVLEYYDLPYRYNQTIVKILYQTPRTLFVYWDVSDEDRNSYIKKYGEHFFESTKPVLIIHNNTMNYSFEIDINDFANCWYFNINDEKCEYFVELGRRPKANASIPISIPNNYIYISSSNKIESPNGHILFEKSQKAVFYRNVKTNLTFSKDITNFEFIKYLGKAYETHDIYQKLYKDEEFIFTSNPTSSFK